MKNKRIFEKIPTCQMGLTSLRAPNARNNSAVTNTEKAASRACIKSLFPIYSYAKALNVTKDVRKPIKATHLKKNVSMNGFCEGLGARLRISGSDKSVA